MAPFKQSSPHSSQGPEYESFNETILGEADRTEIRKICQQELYKTDYEAIVEPIIRVFVGRNPNLFRQSVSQYQPQYVQPAQPQPLTIISNPTVDYNKIMALFKDKMHRFEKKISSQVATQVANQMSGQIPLLVENKVLSILGSNSGITKLLETYKDNLAKTHSNFVKNIDNQVNDTHTALRTMQANVVFSTENDIRTKSKLVVGELLSDSKILQDIKADINASNNTRAVYTILLVGATSLVCGYMGTKLYHAKK